MWTSGPLIPFSSVPLLFMPSFQSALSLDSRIYSSNHPLAHPQLPSCSLLPSFSNSKTQPVIPALSASFSYQNHWCWAGENTLLRSLVLPQIHDHKPPGGPLPCLANLPHLFSQSRLSLFKTNMVKSSHFSNLLPCPFLLTFWWGLGFLFNWKNTVTIWR